MLMNSATHGTLFLFEKMTICKESQYFTRNISQSVVRAILCADPRIKNQLGLFSKLDVSLK